MSTLNYGFVLITRGQFKGRPGYYDDDKGSRCIVYFGAPCLSEFAIVDRKDVERISSATAIKLGWRNEVAPKLYA